MLSLLAIVSVALATPSVSDCGATPWSNYSNKTCGGACVVQTSPLLPVLELHCDAGRTRVAAGAAMDGNGNGYSLTDTADAEFVVLGANGSFGSTGTSRFCCAVTDDDLELYLVRVTGTSGADTLHFKAPSTLSGIDLKNPAATPTHLVAGMIEGGEGGDTLYGASAEDDYVEYLYGEDGDDSLTGSYGDDMLDGGAGNDALSGQGGDDLLIGRGGNDGMAGGADADLLLGEDGNDVLDGGVGDDCLQPELTGATTATTDDVDDSTGADTLVMAVGLTIDLLSLAGEDDACSPGASADGGAECETEVSETECEDRADDWEANHLPVGE